MSPQHDLKERFKRLQSKEQSVPETAIAKTRAVESVNKIELTTSTRSHVHEAVMNCADSEIYDWKKAYRNEFQRPTLDETSDPVIQETQWKIQSLVEHPMLISFHYSQCLSKTLVKLNSYVISRPTFWSQMLSGAGQVHIRSSKNKLQLWMRFNDSTVQDHKRMKNILENEFVANSRQLKAFNIQKIEEWFEISFDINEKSADLRDKEASV
jgi:hypothetical protein